MLVLHCRGRNPKHANTGRELYRRNMTVVQLQLAKGTMYPALSIKNKRLSIKIMVKKSGYFNLSLFAFIQINDLKKKDYQNKLNEIPRLFVVYVHASILKRHRRTNVHKTTKKVCTNYMEIVFLTKQKVT